MEEVDGLCQARSLPAVVCPLRAPLFSKPGLLAGLARRDGCPRAGRTVATETLWVTVSADGSKLPVGLTRLGRGF
jgi:hypothetical protein